MPSKLGSPDAVVLGGGIAGLACAYRLRKLGVKAVLLEAQTNPGGLIRTVRQDGFLFETGPQSFQATETLLTLIGELGLSAELVTADPHAARFVARGGTLRKIPASPSSFLANSLLSAGARWRIVSEPFRRSRPASAEESVAAFVRRRFGHEILEYLVAPFVSGVYAGDPEMLSVRAAFPTLEEWEREHGSVLLGAIRSRKKRQPKRAEPTRLCSFRAGMETLPRALAETLGESLYRDIRVTRIEKLDATYRVRASGTGTNDEELRVGAVVLATPAYVAADLVGGMSSGLARALAGVAYAPAAVACTAYYERQISGALDGFGFLVPRREKMHTLGTVWNTSLFPGRAPQGCVVLTSFLGGATEPDIVARPDAEIADIVHRENAALLAASGAPVSSRVFRHPRALPQYNLGHLHLVETIRRESARFPGLFFTGNYLDGPAIGKCVESGFAAADALIAAGAASSGGKS